MAKKTGVRRTGTDISIRECRSSGYPVVHHYGDNIDPKKEYKVTISNPKMWADGHAIPGTRAFRLYLVNKRMTYEELWRKFEEAGPGIKSYCDFANCPFPAPTEDIKPAEMASLVSIIYGYCGFD